MYNIVNVSNYIVEMHKFHISLDPEKRRLKNII